MLDTACKGATSERPPDTPERVSAAAWLCWRLCETPGQALGARCAHSAPIRSFHRLEA